MTINSDNYIELESEGDQAEAPVTSQGEERKIFTSASDPTIKDLHDRYKDGELALQPDFQRQFVWDATRSSRLIESDLLGVPLPIIYLAEEPNGNESVIMDSRDSPRFSISSMEL